jgi:GAF domain-containing protein
MPKGREREVAAAFVSLASSLAEGHDVVDLLSGLTEECAALLDVASAGLLLADARGMLHVLAASSDKTRTLEVFQLQREQGPCLDCFRTGAAVTVENLQQEAQRWPQFALAALQSGFHSVHALPMRFRDQTLGTLGLFGTTSGKLNEEDLRLGQALADVASIAIAQGVAAADRDRLNEQLQAALSSRVVIEQAKGLLAQLGALEMNEAFEYLRRYSRDHNQPLSDVARALTSRALPAELLLEHVNTKAAKASRPSGRT